MIGVIVFVTGGSIMVLELLGSRMLAPYVGSSLLVWTNIIGIILASLSFGYWLGGNIADRSAHRIVMGRILLLAAASIAVVRALYEPLLLALQYTPFALHWQAFLGGVVLFVVPSTLLAMISPYAVRLTLDKVAHSGSTVGRLSALATVGSIVGTFGAGLWLIPTFGTKTILMLLGLTLLLLALPVLVKRPRHILLWLIVGILTVAANRLTQSNDVLEFDTAYSQIWIYDQPNAQGRNVRWFRQNHDASSAMYLDDPAELVFSYTRAYDLAFSYNPAIEKSLLIGGAAYSYPKHYLASYPEATIDVVEIDPAVTDLARQFYNLKDDPRLQIFHQDARIFLNTARDSYDAIFFDAFNSETIPFHLTTQEVATATRRLLSDNGLVVMNIIASVSGPNSRFLWAEYVTYQTRFPHVTVYQVDPTISPEQTQNIILIAHTTAPTLAAEPLNQTVRDTLAGHIDPPHDTGSVLTDNFAPVEYLVAHAVTDSVLSD